MPSQLLGAMSGLIREEKAIGVDPHTTHGELRYASILHSPH